MDRADPPVNILIVDDEPKNLAVLETVLDDPGYRLVRARSGEEALLALMNEEFAVLVLDVRMPDMSGFEVAQLVKERRKTSRIPIIFLTAYYNEDQHALEGYGSGAVDYLHKPVNPAVLRSKVAVFAELHRQGRMLEELNQTLDERVRARTAELQASEARLREASRRKDEFLATLAHELRNPLAPVGNAVELLKRQSLEPRQVEWATQLLDRQVRALARLIDDLMDVSRVTRGRIELRREVVALADVLADAVETVEPHVRAAGHELVVLPPDPALVVDADRTRLAQAFVNLLHNAVKYTDPGGSIEVGTSVEKGRATVVIRDSGIGIPPEHLDSVFNMFSQVESALSRSRGGLGIGLSLTRRLVQMHGGSIRAFSEGPGRGSRFAVQLPLVPADVDILPAGSGEAQAASAGLRILVADDNVDAAETLAVLLGVMGHTVVQAHDGEAAVAAATQSAPQVAILDIGMPRLNGYEACRRIRAQSNPPPLMVALTGWGQEQDLARSRAAGFDRHLVKPASAEDLQMVLGQVRDAPPNVSARR